MFKVSSELGTFTTKRKYAVKLGGLRARSPGRSQMSHKWTENLMPASRPPPSWEAPTSSGPCALMPSTATYTEFTSSGAHLSVMRVGRDLGYKRVEDFQPESRQKEPSSHLPVKRNYRTCISSQLSRSSSSQQLQLWLLELP